MQNQNLDHNIKDLEEMIEVTLERIITPKIVEKVIIKEGIV